MRILVVDDEAAARRRLVSLLSELDEEVVAEAENGLQALERAASLRPDLLLLDIAMPEVDGLDVAARLEDPKPLVIFQTAYDHYALQAFEHEAIDYVLKPVTRERLGKALDRARQRLEGRMQRGLSPELVEQLRGYISPEPRPRSSRVLVRERAGYRLLPHREVLRFQVEDGLLYAQTREGRHLTDFTLQQMEQRTAGGFIQASRSELVNLEHVARLTANGDGSALLTLSDGSQVRVSRRRAAEVRRALEA